MTFKDQLNSDIDNIFLNNDEFSREVVANGVTTNAIFDLEQDLLQKGDNFYNSATIWLKDSEVVLEIGQEVSVDGIFYRMYQKVQSDGYMTQYLLRNKEAHRFD